MNVLNRLYEWYGKRNVLILIGAVVLLAIAGLILNVFTSNKEEIVTEEPTLALVTVSRVDQLGTQSLFRVIGEVRAVSEARLQAESGGRITAVNVSLGDRVGAGAIIASMENSAQRAALLQAEGAYDAALAGAVSSESSTESAETGLDASLASGVNAYKSAFISADSSVRNTIDDFFNDPTGAIPGFKLDAFGTAPTLNTERGQIEIILDTWSADTQTTNTKNVETRLGSARSDVERIAEFAEKLAGIVARQDTSSSFTQAQKDAAEAALLGVRSALNGTGVALEGSITAIDSAREALTRAEIAGTGSTVSLSQAQVKSALGSLRAAQSAYEKTLVRTPISGIVNALYLKTGQYAAPGTPAAIIANNNALEIVTALSEDDASLVSIGDSVLIEGEVGGIITAIAPAIDPLSGKKEIHIGVEEDIEVTNGDTVTIEFKRSEVKSNDTITVPLSALKITATAPLAFSVNDDNTLKAHTVVLGPIMGDVVVVEEGLTADMIIVTDARGLKEGEKVEVTK
jgi:HlyD family secretion protein